MFPFHDARFPAEHVWYHVCIKLGYACPRIQYRDDSVLKGYRCRYSTILTVDVKPDKVHTRVQQALHNNVEGRWIALQ
jgi:hypothetical protein